MRLFYCRKGRSGIELKFACRPAPKQSFGAFRFTCLRCKQNGSRHPGLGTIQHKASQHCEAFLLCVSGQSLARLLTERGFNNPRLLIRCFI
jgi:hypothetical protein